MDVAPVAEPVSVRLATIESTPDLSGSFTDCRLDYDVSGNLHVAYRFESGTGSAELRYAVNTSGEWRTDSVGQFTSMQRSFDIAVENRQPRILFAASRGSSDELIDANLEFDGEWSEEAILTGIGDLDPLRLASNSVANEVRAVIPPTGTEFFRDASIRFGDWQVEPVGRAPLGGSVLGFDMAIDRFGDPHACVTSNTAEGQILFYGQIVDDEWTFEEAYRERLAARCRIGVDRDGLIRIGAMEQTIAQNEIILLEQGRARWERTGIAIATFGDFDMVTGSDGSITFSWIDATSRELVLAPSVTAFEQQRLSEANAGSSASLALSPDGSIAFCSEFRDVTEQRVITGIVPRPTAPPSQ